MSYAAQLCKSWYSQWSLDDVGPDSTAQGSLPVLAVWYGFGLVVGFQSSKVYSKG